MSDSQNKNFSLLTQSEVDTLVTFLQGKKKEVDSSVLNQNSIDKLIELLKFDERGGSKVWTSGAGINGIMADLITVRKQEDDICELTFSVNDANDFIQLSVTNKSTGEQMEITPKLFHENDSEEWGRCIAPEFLNRLARVLDVKYTTKTHEAICERYAECLFGDASYKLPNVFLPDDSEVIEELL